MNIIVIGSGSVALQACLFLQKEYGNITFIESRKTLISNEKQCLKHGIKYDNIVGKELTTKLLSINDITLIISIANRYLFPREVVMKPNLRIINYHGALLPKYPGRNAEAWTIFHQEEKAGITWHYVSTDVDAGDILKQKSIKLKNTTTSIELLRINGRLAIDGLKEIIHEVIEGTAPTIPNHTNKDRVVYYSWMKPNNGVFDSSWSFEKASAFLRCMDYGPLKIIGEPTIRIDDTVYTIKKYQIIDETSINSKIDFDVENSIATLKWEVGSIKLNVTNSKKVSSELP